MRISYKSWFYLSQNVGRHIDRIIGFQSQVNCILMPVSLSFLCGMWWIKDLSYFITKKGCYVATFLGFFHVNYMQCHSFFTCLFRYICILHPKSTSKFGSNAPKVSIVICEVSLRVKNHVKSRKTFVLSLVYTVFHKMEMKIWAGPNFGQHIMYCQVTAFCV